MIAALAPRGVRCIAPDLLGLGQSSPLALGQHSLARHHQVMTSLLDALEVRRCVVAGQDWGGPIAAAVAASRPERVIGAVLGNTSITTPNRPIRGTWFHRLSHIPLVSEGLFVGAGFPLPVMHRVQGNPKSIGRFEKRAYRWPLRGTDRRSAPLALARMVPSGEGHPTLVELDRIDQWARSFRGATGLVWGRKDPLLGRLLARHRRLWPDACVEETDAGHFSQEEVPEVWADVIETVLARAKQRDAP